MRELMTAKATLPDDFTNATLAGRVWLPAAGGPAIVRIDGNDRVFDVSAFDSIRIPGMKNLWCMLNFLFFVETDVDKRAFLYIDSVCISGDF